MLFFVLCDSVCFVVVCVCILFPIYIEPGLSCEGLVKVCEGLVKVCEGLVNVCEGLVKVCEGLVDVCECLVKVWLY